MSGTQKVVIALFVGLGIHTRADAQVYHITETASLLTSLDTTENPGTPVLFGPAAITETVVIDPNAPSIRQFGSLSFVGAPAVQTVTHVTEAFQPQFPNLPRTVSGDLTLSLSVPDQTLSFDTGPRDIFWTGSSYGFSGWVQTSTTLVATVAYSLSTDGHTYADTFPVNLAISIGPADVTRLTELDLSGYPASIGLIPESSLSVAETGLFSFVAPNGLSVGAALVPEPASGSLLVLAFSGFWIVRLRRAQARLK